MAKTKIEIELDFKGQNSVAQVEEKTKSLKAQLKEMKALLASGTLDNDQFRKLSLEAGQLQDRIADVNQRVKNLASDSRRLDAFVNLAQGIVGGFAAVQGVIALVGDENEELQKTMVRLQGALAALNGIQAIANVLNKDSAVNTVLLGNANIFNTIKTQASTAATTLYTFVTNGATVATKAFRIALLATGIGAVVVLLGALATSMTSAGESTDETTKKIKEQNEALEKHREALEKDSKEFVTNRDAQNGGLNDMIRYLAVLKAKGATAKEIYEQEKKIRQAERDDLNYQLAYNTGNIKLEQEITQKLRDNENAQLVSDYEFKNKLAEEAEQRRKKREDNLKKSDEAKLAKLKRDAELAQEDAQMERDLIASLQDEGKASEEAKIKQEEFSKAYRLQLSVDRYRKQQEIDAYELAEWNKTQQAKAQIYKDTTDSIMYLGEVLAGEQFRQSTLGKAVAISQIAVDTALAISSLTKNSEANPANAPTSGLAGALQFAAGMVRITASIAKAKSILTSGATPTASGTPSSGSSSMGVGSMASAPNTNRFTPTTTSGGQSSQRVYVLEKDITDSQGRVAKIRHNATLI